MARKVSWYVFSRRRKITIAGLFESGKVKTYEDYVRYCDRLNVGDVLTREEFRKETPKNPKNALKQLKKSTAKPATIAPEAVTPPARDETEHSAPVPISSPGVDSVSTSSPDPETPDPPKPAKKKRAPRRSRRPKNTVPQKETEEE